MNRWLSVVGGISMNLALGSLYAWSVFVAPLEAEFGWDRSQTSWVFSIAIVTIALSFILAGRIQDARVRAFVQQLVRRLWASDLFYPASPLP